MGKSSINQKELFNLAGELLFDNKKINTDVLCKNLGIGEDEAEAILNNMEAYGVIESDEDGNRNFAMSKEEFETTFNINTGNQKNESVVSQTPIYEAPKKSTTSIPPQQVTKKKKGGFFSCLFKLLILGLIAYLIYRFAPISTIMNNIPNLPSIPGLTNKQSKVSETEAKKIGWVQNGSKWNYYDDNGNQVKGMWIDKDGHLYYFDLSGNMMSNTWINYLGKDYYVDSEGRMLRNQWIANTYYVGEDGAKLTNTMTPDGFYVGADGKYVKKTTPVITPTTAPPVQTTIPPIVPSTAATNIVPTESPYSNNTNIANSDNEVKKVTYTLKSTENYSQNVYLSIDKTCNIKLILPIFADNNGNVATNVNNRFNLEKDNILNEFAEIVDGSTEEEEDSNGYTSYKYISSVKMSEGRLASQDEYTMMYKMTGKANWNNGKTERVSVVMTYDKENGDLTYYIDQ